MRTFLALVTGVAAGVALAVALAGRELADGRVTPPRPLTETPRPGTRGSTPGHLNHRASEVPTGTTVPSPSPEVVRQEATHNVAPALPGAALADVPAAGETTRAESAANAAAEAAAVRAAEIDESKTAADDAEKGSTA